VTGEVRNASIWQPVSRLSLQPLAPSMNSPGQTVGGLIRFIPQPEHGREPQAVAASASTAAPPAGWIDRLACFRCVTARVVSRDSNPSAVAVVSMLRGCTTAGKVSETRSAWLQRNVW